MINFNFKTKTIRNGFIIEIVDNVVTLEKGDEPLPIFCEDTEQVIRNFVLKLVPSDEARDILHRAFPHSARTISFKSKE